MLALIARATAGLIVGDRIVRHIDTLLDTRAPRGRPVARERRALRPMYHPQHSNCWTHDRRLFAYTRHLDIDWLEGTRTAH